MYNYYAHITYFIHCIYLFMYLRIYNMECQSLNVSLISVKFLSEIHKAQREEK